MGTVRVPFVIFVKNQGDLCSTLKESMDNKALPELQEGSGKDESA